MKVQLIPWFAVVTLALALAGALAACQPVRPRPPAVVTPAAKPAPTPSPAPDTATAPGLPAPTVTFTATEYAYAGPVSISGGLTRIELANAGEQPHMLWLVKLDEGKGVPDVMGVFANFAAEPAFPAWMTWYGGVTAAPGDSSAYTIDLAPGTYALFSMQQGEDGEPDAAKGMTATLEVTGAPAAGAVPPVADLRVELLDFSFVVDGTPASGPLVAEVANTGAEAHEVVLLKLAAGSTVQDAVGHMMAGEAATGEPPFEFYGGTGPIGAGLTAWYEVNVPPGEYGITCFLPSVADGAQSHLMLGMVSQITVP